MSSDRRHRGSVAAFTLLEVMLAVALLATVAATLAGGYGAIRTMTLRDQERLNACEVAHRLILIYTHMGPDQLPDSSEAIEQGKGQYSFSMSEEPLIEEKGQREGLSVRKARATGTLSANERIGAGLIMITINVYPYDEGHVAGRAAPLASLSRILDPFDSSNPEVLLEHVIHLLGKENIPAPAAAP